jgi:hypothetical protein
LPDPWPTQALWPGLAGRQPDELSFIRVDVEQGLQSAARHLFGYQKDGPVTESMKRLAMWRLAILAAT